MIFIWRGTTFGDPLSKPILFVFTLGSFGPGSKVSHANKSAGYLLRRKSKCKRKVRNRAALRAVVAAFRVPTKPAA
jgi:hypothetical protein